MDPRTRTYALVGGEDYRRRPLGSAWALERFPARARGGPRRLSRVGLRPEGAACRRPRSSRRATARRAGTGAASPVDLGEQPSDRRAHHRAGCPGRVHDAEGERLRQLVRLGPVGDERGARRVDPARRERGSDDEERDEDGGRDQGEPDRGDREQLRVHPDRIEASAAVAEASEDRGERHLDEPRQR